MASYYKCDLNYDCFNCWHSDCIDGVKVPKKEKPIKEPVVNYPLWKERNPIKVSFIKRKSTRKKRVLNGTATIGAFARIGGEYQPIYKGKTNYYLFVEDEYFELCEYEVRLLLKEGIR